MHKITAIVGRNGSGKTLYVEKLRRDMASDKLRYIAFSDSYGPAVDKAYYLQLRWNQHDIDPETPNVRELLERAYNIAGEDTPERRELQRHLYELFHMEPLLDKYVITLSSGELRKFQLTKTLFANPKLLIMENPFIGLDAETRDQLKDLLKLLVAEHDIDIMLVLSKTDDIPDSVSEVIEIRDAHVMEPCTKEQYDFRQVNIPEHVLSKDEMDAILDLPYKDNDYHTDEVINMRNVSIRYGDRTILKTSTGRCITENGGHCQDRTGAESLPYSPWYVRTTRRATPVTSPSSTISVVRERVSGTSRSTSATCRPRCTAPICVTSPP